MEKILVKTSRCREYVDGIEDDDFWSDDYWRTDLLVLSLDSEVRVTFVQAFCLGDETAGTAGRPLDKLTFPISFGEMVNRLNFNSGCLPDEDGWILSQKATFPDAAEVLRLMSATRRSSVSQAILKMIRRDWDHIDNFLKPDQFAKRVTSLCNPVKIGTP